MTRRALEGRLAGDMALAVGCSPERFIVMLVTDMSESCEVVVLVLPPSPPPPPLPPLAHTTRLKKEEAKGKLQRAPAASPQPV